MPSLQLIIFPSPSYPFPSPLISLSLSLSLNKNKRQSKRQQDVEQREEVEKEQVKCNGFFPVVHPHLSKSLSFKPRFSSITCSSLPQQPRGGEDSVASSLKTFSTAVALSSILLSSAAAPPPAVADIAGLTPCKESKAFAKREKQSIKKLEASLKKYAPGSAPALAINATIEKTKRRFDNYGKFGLLCGSDGLPHLIVSGDQRHWGEFITPGFLFLYIAGWIGWVGRSYLIAIRDDKKPTMKEIIIDVPLASRLLWRGFIWPVAAYRELVNGDLIAKDV